MKSKGKGEGGGGAEKSKARAKDANKDDRVSPSPLLLLSIASGDNKSTPASYRSFSRTRERLYNDSKETFLIFPFARKVSNPCIV